MTHQPRNAASRRMTTPPPHDRGKTIPLDEKWLDAHIDAWAHENGMDPARTQTDMNPKPDRNEKLA